jgi:S-DNA-T family DNA segregation ATPase FtsK/SpoIIIE
MSDNTTNDMTNDPIEVVGGPEESNVHYLPAHADRMERTEIEPAGPVLEGEIVTAQEYNARQKAAAIERYKGYRQDAVTVYRGAKTVVTHQRTKTVVRHTLAYPVAGVGVVWQRWRDAHGGNRYERQMRAAEAGGDQEALRYWQEANVAEKARRHDRVMDWLTLPGKVIKFGLISIVGLAGFLLVLGVILAINNGNFADIIGPITAVFNAVATVVWFFTTYGILLILGGTAATLFYLYNQGRSHAHMPQWLATPTGQGDVMDLLPDENTIVNALKNLNIAGFKTALKEGWRVRFRQIPHVDGKGWRAQLDLPPACSVEEIVKRKNMLAHNLVRYPIEVWPTEPQPSVLDLWVANPGALSGPVDPWPLLADLDNATCDYFTGVPAGVTIKGDVVRGRLSEANYVVGGMMGSGKSSLVITLILGAMLDPLVDIDVVVMAENADYEPMRRRLRSLVTGAGEETVQTCLTMLYALYEELSVRGKALREHDARAVTRKLAEKDKRLRPRIMVIDECQNLFIGEHGKAAIEVASKLMSTARKYAITLLFLTPEPSKDACPRKITAIASNKACFAIGDQLANDAVLGTGSYKSGISAVGLTPKTDDGPGDVGTCMQRGFTGTPGLLRSFFVPQDDAHRVTDRAMQLREQAGITTVPVEVEPEEQRDPLADIVTVLGDAPRMKTMDVLQRLVELHRPTYQDWTARTLTAFLTDHQAEPYKTAGAMQISAARIHEALTVRDENMGDDTD